MLRGRSPVTYCGRRGLLGIIGHGRPRSTKVREATMFKRIDHVEIVTDQLDRTVQFYTEVLGFTVKARDRIERLALGVPIDLVYLDLGGTVVELISYEGAAVEPAPQTEHLGYRMIALEVDDMQKTADYLRTKTVTTIAITTNPHGPGSGRSESSRTGLAHACQALCLPGPPTRRAITAHLSAC